jgi:4'-phosphopantetheinyl transferase
LGFNVSHSGELALVAVTAGVAVGVDVEAVRGMEDALRISERFFSAAERVVLAACPAAERDAAFFRCWTRKEAYVKAVGDGIALGLDRFDVSLDEGEGARFLALESDAGRAAWWSLTHVDPGPGYVGALALPAHPRAVRGFEWRPPR